MHISYTPRKPALKSSCYVIIVQSLSCIGPFFDHLHPLIQAPLSMRFPKQEYWNGLPFPSPGNFPDPGIEPVSPTAPALQADSLGKPIHGNVVSQELFCLFVSFLPA